MVAYIIGVKVQDIGSKPVLAGSRHELEALRQILMESEHSLEFLCGLFTEASPVEAWQTRFDCHLKLIVYKTQRRLLER